jgi:V/A-type H+-transporting ATPase subunit I
MIVPMKSVTLLCLLPDQDRTLKTLREMGVLHLAPVVTPDSEELGTIRSRLAAARETVEALAGPISAPVATGGGDGADEVVRKVQDLLHRLKETQGALDSLERESAALAPYGNFDLDSVRRLQEGGVEVRLFQLPSGEALPEIEGAMVRVLSDDRTNQYLAVISRGPVECGGREFPLPTRSLKTVEAERESARQAVEESRRMLVELRGRRPDVEQRVRRLEDEERFLLARDGMGSWDRITYLKGYCPARTEARLREAVAAEGWGLLVRDPEPDEPVPTLLSNARWVQPIKAVFDMIGILPGYQEIDISACFLLFFSLFFAMLVGDAGYGLVFLLLTVAARMKMPRAPIQPFALMGIMSVSTLIWGVLTGTYFGIANPAAWLLRFKIEWLSNEDNLKLFCFGIGTVHLMVAHAWNGFRNRRTWQALAQLGWMGTTLCMFYFSRFMVLAYPLPGFVVPLLAGSIVLIVLFMTPIKAFKEEWFNHAMLPLSLVSNFMDVVSYVRLYAVGMASLALAMAFNDMAAGFGDGVGATVGAALVLFLGHALNLVLSAMGVLVHGVRLNALEFSSHIGLSWSGFAYNPFAKSGEKSGK